MVKNDVNRCDGDFSILFDKKQKIKILFHSISSLHRNNARPPIHWNFIFAYISKSKYNFHLHVTMN